MASQVFEGLAYSRRLSGISFPSAQEPPDWLRAVVGIAVALTIVVATRGKLSVSADG
jgi:hypothetical protein